MRSASDNKYEIGPAAEGHQQHGSDAAGLYSFLHSSAAQLRAVELERVPLRDFTMSFEQLTDQKQPHFAAAIVQESLMGGVFARFYEQCRKVSFVTDHRRCRVAAAKQMFNTVLRRLHSMMPIVFVAAKLRFELAASSRAKIERSVGVCSCVFMFVCVFTCICVYR